MSQMRFANRTSLISAAAVAGYVALIALAIALTWNSLSAIAERSASVAAAETMLAQWDARSPSGQPGASPLAAAPEGSPFLEGETVNVGGAALLQRIAATIRKNGGNVLSSQVDLDSDRAKDGWISLLVSCDLAEGSLQYLLYDIEAGMPVLFIDRLAVEAPTTGVNGGRMKVLMAVSGQWWNGK